VIRDRTADWRDLAACAAVDPELHHPTGSTGARYEEQVADARAVCNTCQVAGDCWLHNMSHELGRPADARYGIWAALTPQERARMDPTAPDPDLLLDAPAAGTVSTDLAATLAEFSPRDRRIITGIVHGLGNQALADQEGVSLSSIRSCITRCLARLGLTSRVQLVVFAYESGLVIPGSAGAGLRPLGEAS
jgi:DNA-binding CsgD family transcriptional regulator